MLRTRRDQVITEVRTHDLTPSDKSAVFIVGAPKSGTTLLMALFDSHPQIVSYPLQLKYYEMFSGAENIALASVEAYRRIFMSKSKIRYFYNERLKGENLDQSTYDLGRFDHELLAQKLNAAKIDTILQSYGDEACDRKRFFYLAHFALAESGGRDWSKIKIILSKSGFWGLSYIDEMLRDFPDAKIIHVIRDPLRNYASKIRIGQRLWPDDETFCAVDEIRAGFEAACKYQAQPNYRLLKYEDLVNDPQKIMRGMCDWLGLDYEDSLLRPSILGDAWSGNSSQIGKLDHISAEPAGRTTSDVGILRRWILRRGLSSVPGIFGYDEQMKKKLNILQRLTVIGYRQIYPLRCFFRYCLRKALKLVDFHKYFKKLNGSGDLS